jgi:hypothetical protein
VQIDTLVGLATGRSNRMYGTAQFSDGSLDWLV